MLINNEIARLKNNPHRSQPKSTRATIPRGNSLDPSDWDVVQVVLQDHNSAGGQWRVTPGEAFGVSTANARQ
ncbi:hypothetical protein MFFC18_14900 [Mariniblastus fucicola]|uniref:Uncharacterized protein n=1 Tax=Mariniblastus fucicola TaxID=980251 RepID=A0A5B9P9K6_9BACT|nr:hypothetical protein MFFC18_14900 [Mariniblastus fucicola]